MSGREIYYPLLWHLHGVKACPQHGIRLGTVCPACKVSFHPLTAHARPGYCPRCRGWLGTTACEDEVGDRPELARDVATAQRMADFLLAGQEQLKSANAPVFAPNLQRLLDGHFAGNVAALARFLGVHRYSVLAWKSGLHRPTLLSLADVSLRVNVSMAGLVGTELGAADFTVQSDGDRQPARRRFASPPKTDLDKMKLLLEEAAKGDVFPAPSLNQIALKLQCNQSTLTRRFPELAARVKEKYQRFCEIRIEVRSQLFRSIVNARISDLLKSGVYPSQCKVRESLPKLMDFREPVVQQEWKQALLKLKPPAG